MDLEERRDRYRRTVLAGAEAELAGAVQGKRGQTLNDVAFHLGHRVEGGVLSDGEAWALLEPFALACADREAPASKRLRAARRALDEGKAKPLGWPPELDPLAPSSRGRARGPGRARGTPARPAAPSPAPDPGPPPAYPPRAEVLALWAACVPVTASTPEAEACAAWLRSRGLDPERVAELDLARALPPAEGDPDPDAFEAWTERAAIMEHMGGLSRGKAEAAALAAARLAFPSAVLRVLPELPPWAAMGRRDWRETGHLLVVPGIDATGSPRSLHARNVGGKEPKTAWPSGHEARGLVFANRLALALLAGQEEARDLVIAEGVPDFLTQAARGTRTVLGIVGGGWTPEHAAKVPDGAKVAIRTHTDETGDKYAEHIRQTFKDRRVNLARTRRDHEEP